MALMWRAVCLVAVLLQCQAAAATWSWPSLGSLLSGRSKMFPGLHSAGKQSGSVAVDSKRVGADSWNAYADDTASLYFVARQHLLDFATVEGLQVLQSIAGDLDIPEFQDDADVGLFGHVHITVSDLQVVSLSVPPSSATTHIDNGQYWFKAEDVASEISFNWHWEKGLVHGSGTGTLMLQGGNVDIIFGIGFNESSQKPTVTVTYAQTKFERADVDLHSYKVDWLYQLLLKVFHDKIKSQIENAIEHGIEHKVPEKLNSLLETVPSDIDIKGLPFKTSFSYSVYTLDYVLVKGFGAFESKQGGPDFGSCPFEVARIPVHYSDVQLDHHMITMFGDESIMSCLLWILYTQGDLKATVNDGDLPKLRLTTAILGGLYPVMPQLNTLYPGKPIRLDFVVTDVPSVNFSPNNNSTISLSFTTQISVLHANAADDTIVVGTIATDMQADFNIQWDSTVSLGSRISSQIVDSIMPANVGPWNSLLGMALKSFAPALTLRKMIQDYVHVPVPMTMSLENVVCNTYDHWFGLSGDLVLTNPSVLGLGKVGNATVVV